MIYEKGFSTDESFSNLTAFLILCREIKWCSTSFEGVVQEPLSSYILLFFK